jgi:4-oxalmesaconate hydratase
MHGEQPSRIVPWFCEETSYVIRRARQLYPTRSLAVTGLPRRRVAEPATRTAERRRWVIELGFVWAILNPDPKEGQGPPPPPLGDRHRVPIYKALCELDVPALVHPAGCRPPARERYSLHLILEETVAVARLVTSKVARNFFELRLIVSHGGDAIAYQAGRFLVAAAAAGPTSTTSFEPFTSTPVSTPAKPSSSPYGPWARAGAALGLRSPVPAPSRTPSRVGETNGEGPKRLQKGVVGA